ncbi:hypothetical protein [Sulfurimonas sp.]|uniref:hypothetical protein n=1 Tax=Sulfurimonas sp. TaxID=2022749 RepID=UPI002624FB5B|nr:hypothetical protein [Sulfurimonas sp.]MDD3452555.1 hypothetical protein [Sulfurimonas sp.]
MADCENLTPYEGTIPGTPGLSTVQEMAACNGYRGWFLTTFIPWLQNAYQNICVAVGLADGLIDTSKYDGEYVQGGTYDKGRSVSIGDIIYISKIDANTTTPPNENWVRTSTSWGSVIGSMAEQQDLSEALSLKIGNLADDGSPSLGGVLDGRGNYIKDVWYNQTDDVSVSTGTHTLYFSTGNRQKITAGGNFTLAFGGVSANQNVYVIEAVNWGAYTITFPANLKVEDGTLPEFTVSGTDLIIIEVDKNGTYTLSVIALNTGVVAV